MYFQYCGFSQDRNIYGLLVAKNDVKVDADSLSHGTKTSLKSLGVAACAVTRVWSRIPGSRRSQPLSAMTAQQGVSENRTKESKVILPGITVCRGRL